MRKMYVLFLCCCTGLSCGNIKTVYVMPMDKWPELRPYMGMSSLPYPDTALQRLNEFIRPMGYYAGFKNGCLTCTTKDTALHLTPTQYKLQKLDKDARIIYRAVYGDKKHPNKWARLSVLAFIMRVDFAADLTDNSLYSIDFWYRDWDNLFSDLTPF